MTYTLYTARGSCALAVHIALCEADAPFEIARIDTRAGEQRSESYLALNPKGRVPALATPQGVLTEVPALLVYIAQCHPQARLAPLDDPYAFARLQSFNAYLSSTVHVAHAHGPRASRWADEPEAQAAMKRKVPETMTAAAAMLESMIEGPWVFGERYTIADPYLYTIAGWMEDDGVDTTAFPKLLAQRALCAQRPAVQRALAEISR